MADNKGSVVGLKTPKTIPKGIRSGAKHSTTGAGRIGQFILNRIDGRTLITALLINVIRQRFDYRV